MTNRAKMIIIYNPNAGRKSSKLFKSVLSELDNKNANYHLMPTEYAGHGLTIANEYMDDDNVEIIVAAGGDGTINEIINGMNKSRKSLGIIPLGTANVLAKEIGLSNAVNDIVRTLLSQKTKDFYLAQINDQKFSLMASVGYDALAVKNVNLTFKKKFGEVAYLWAFVKGILFSDNIEYVVKDKNILHKCYGAIVTNGKYYGGKYICAPDASIEENKLYVILFKSKGAVAAIRYFLAIIANRLDKLKDVEIFPTQKVEILSNQKAPIQVDGDHMGELPVTISISEKPISIIVP